MNHLEFVQTVTVIVFILFAIAMVLIGISSFRKVKSIDSFLIGGRNIGGWLSAFAYGTSYFSAVIFVGYAGKHGWDVGIGAMWIGVGNAVLGCFLSWKLLAKRTRDMTHKLKAKTMPEFFGARYKSRNMKICSALIIFIFLVPYSSAVYKGLGYTFNTIFPSISVNFCMLAIAVLTAVYLILGGYVATAYTDFIQGLIMIAGIICMVIAIIRTDAVGGLTEGLARLAAIPDNGDGITGSQLTSLWGGDSWRFLCVNILLTSFGTWGLPQMVNKFYAVKDDKAIKQATIISTVFCLIIGVGAYATGAFSRLVLGNKLPEAGHDGVIPSMLMEALNGNTYTIIILAVIVILLFSASMSTLSAIVLSSSSAVSVDLLPEFRKSFGGKQQMSLTRALCLLFIALSFVFATMNISIIVNIMSFSWGVVAGCFIGPYVWGLFSERTTKAGAACGMLGGLLTVGIPTIIITASSGFPAAVAFAPEMGVVAMAVSIAIVPIVSKINNRWRIS
ncbi:MAG: sodium:solute symporter [Clostridiales bacterium]|nr:sodium:solute symporter [Clostridiales bacterium]